MVTIRYLPTGCTHRVYAGGGPGDGSLSGFTTLCGRPIADPAQWREEPTATTCGACERFERTLSQSGTAAYRLLITQGAHA